MKYAEAIRSTEVAEGHRRITNEATSKAATATLANDYFCVILCLLWMYSPLRALAPLREIIPTLSARTRAHQFESLLRLHFILILLRATMLGLTFFGIAMSEALEEFFHRHQQ